MEAHTFYLFQTVRVLRGPFRDFIGEVVTIHTDQIGVMVNLFTKKTVLNLAPDDLEDCSQPKF